MLSCIRQKAFPEILQRGSLFREAFIQGHAGLLRLEVLHVLQWHVQKSSLDGFQRPVLARMGRRQAPGGCPGIVSEGAGCAAEQVARQLVKSEGQRQPLFRVVQPPVVFALGALLHQFAKSRCEPRITLLIGREPPAHALRDGGRIVQGFAEPGVYEFCPGPVPVQKASRASKPNGSSASRVIFRCCAAIGSPMIVMANSSAMTRWKTASSRPGRIIQMMFMITATAPPGGSFSRISWPKGISARPASLKHWMPNGIPMMVMHNRMPPNR